MSDFGRRWRGLAAALVVPPLLTAVLTTLTERLNLSSQVLIYLVALVAIARVCGMVPALVAAIWAALLLDYYFISPVHTFRIAVANDVIAFLAFVIVAVTVASVVEYSGKQFRRATRAAAEAAQLEAADRMRTALLNAVSHDLRAPLAAALASVDTLRDARFELSETERGELLGAAHTSLGRLSRLVEDLLDMSRLQVRRAEAASGAGLGRGGDPARRGRRADRRRPGHVRGEPRRRAPGAGRRRAAGARRGQPGRQRRQAHRLADRADGGAGARCDGTGDFGFPAI